MSGDTKVAALISSLQHGGRALDNIPSLVKQVIEMEAWRERTVQSTGQIARFDSFTEFCTTAPPEGLGCEVDRLKRLCSDDDETARLIRQATTGEVGDNQHTTSEGTSNRSGHGTTKDYTLDRLHREAPDLYEAVVDDEMSANAAAIQAGFRTKTVSVPIHKGGEPQIERAADSLEKHFGEHLPVLLAAIADRC